MALPYNPPGEAGVTAAYRTHSRLNRVSHALKPQGRENFGSSFSLGVGLGGGGTQPARAPLTCGGWGGSSMGEDPIEPGKLGFPFSPAKPPAVCLSHLQTSSRNFLPLPTHHQGKVPRFSDYLPLLWEALSSRDR